MIGLPQTWGESARRPVAVSSARWGRDLVIGWAAPWGPSLARVPRGQSSEDARGLVLGEPGGVPVAPQLVEAGERLAVVWIDAGGAAGALLDEPHDGLGSTPATLLVAGAARGDRVLSCSPRVSIADGARAIATARGNDHGWIAAATSGEVILGRVDGAGRIWMEDAPWIARHGPSPRIAVADVQGEPILAAIYPGERELVVARRDGGRPTVVSHRLDRPVVDLAMCSAGSRLALALLEQDAGRASCAFLDARGRMTERPVATIDRYVGEHAASDLDGIAVVWVDDVFRLVVRDRATRSAYVCPFLEPAQRDVSVVAKIVGPPHASFSAPRLELVSAETDDDEGRLSIVRARANGSESAPLEVRLAPPAAVARSRGTARAHACCVEVARSVAGASYRDSTLVAEPTEDGARLALESTRQSLAIRFEADRRFVVHLETRGEGEEPLAVEAGTYERLARWLRQRLSTSARSAAEREDAWARELAAELAGSIHLLGTSVRAATATGVVLEVILSAVPHPDALARWITRVRADVRSGRHRSVEAAPPAG